MSNDDDDDKTGGGKKREKRRRNKGGDHYDVGYCKPPVEHRWGRGYCPNRRGRPKNKPINSETDGELITRILAEKVGRADGREMNLRELAYRSMIKVLASKGNIKGFKELLKTTSSKETHDDGIDHVASFRKKMDDLAERVKERATQERAREREAMRREIEEEVRKKLEEDRSKTH